LRGNGSKLIPPSEKPLIKIECTLLEWLQIQAHFPMLAQKADGLPYHENIRNKLEHLENVYSKFDLYGPLELYGQIHAGEKVDGLTTYPEVNEKLVATIEKAESEKDIIEIVFHNEKKVEVYPHRIVHLDGDISLICEDKFDKSIVHFFLKDVKEATINSTDYHPTFTSIEIDDFINSLRAISETEIRLILKMHGENKSIDNPNFQHLGNPCLITNPKGEMIWAASVEPSEALMEWLYQQGSEVEILDPASFRAEFLQYCEAKLKKSA
jgi:predicted DNA-binding transcriptional regulator YafY